MTCVSGPCMVSESLKRFQESNTEGFELALKSSSATAFIGQYSFILASAPTDAGHD